MRASERERRHEGKCGVVLEMLTADGPVWTDAAQMTPEQILLWVQTQPRHRIEAIVYEAVIEARARRPRL